MPQARRVPKSAFSSDPVASRKAPPVRLADDPGAFAAVASPSIALQRMISESLVADLSRAQSGGALTPMQKLAIWIALTTGLWAMIGLAIYAVLGLAQAA
jgi:hypothetical protein